MINLREMAERHLSVTLEGHFALPVTLISPSGIKDEVSGQVLYDTSRFNPDTGQMVIVNTPIVSLRVSSLKTEPIAGEKWVFQIPKTPNAEAEKVSFLLDPSKAPEGGASIGFKRFYLKKIDQS